MSQRPWCIWPPMRRPGSPGRPFTSMVGWQCYDRCVGGRGETMLSARCLVRSGFHGSRPAVGHDRISLDAGPNRDDSPKCFTGDFPNSGVLEPMSEIADKVKKIVVEHLGVEESKVTPEASFIDDLGADSLDTVELVMAFEEAFGVEIPEDAAEKISTVKDAIEYIEKQKAA